MAQRGPVPDLDLATAKMLECAQQGQTNIAPGQPQQNLLQFPHPHPTPTSFVYGSPPQYLGGYGQMMGQMVIHPNQHQHLVATSSGNGSYIATMPYQNIPVQNHVPMQHHPTQYFTSAPMSPLAQYVVVGQQFVALPQPDQALNQFLSTPAQRNNERHQEMGPEEQNCQLKAAENSEIEDRDDAFAVVLKSVLENTIKKPSFSKAYAEMLHSICQQSTHIANRFQKKLLDQCVLECEHGIAEEIQIIEHLELEDGNQKPEVHELERRRCLNRSRSSANLRLIAEFYKIQLLSPRIMMHFIKMLLDAKGDESLTNLCALLTEAGRKLDDELREHEINNAELLEKNLPLTWIPEPNFMDDLFNKIKEHSVRKSLPVKIRYIVHEICELRKKGWEPRREVVAPKAAESFVKNTANEESKNEEANISSINTPASAKQDTSNNDWKRVTEELNSIGFIEAETPTPVAKTTCTANVVRPEEVPIPMKPYFDHPEMEVYPLASRFKANPEEQVPVLVKSNQQSNKVRKSSKAVDVYTEETVSLIFQEFLSLQKGGQLTHLILGVDWIKSTFSGSVAEFVDILSRQVGHMSEEKMLKEEAMSSVCAGILVKILLERRLTEKTQILRTLKDGVIRDMSRMLAKSPHVTKHLALFLTEIFSNEEDLYWLVSMGEGTKESVSWEDLVTNTINVLKLRWSELVVQDLYRETPMAFRLPTQKVPWIAGVDTPESLTQKMKLVLEKSADVPFMLTKLSLDIREIPTLKSVIEAICRICLSDDRKWHFLLLDKLLSQIKLFSVKLKPLVWRQAKDFVTKNGIDQAEELRLWNLMLKRNLITEELLK